jgi:hypothetical protein
MKSVIFPLILALLPLTTFGETKGKIELVISVDWEAMGGFVRPWHQDGGIAPNVMQSFKDLRAALPKTSAGRAAPMVQLLNPAYFTQPQFDKRRVSEQILSLLDAGDEFGLHIHAYKSLLDAAGVSAANRFHFSFYDGPGESADWDKKLNPDGTCVDSSAICGYGIPLFNFRYDELRSLIRTSKNLLRENGISRFFGDQPPTIFRASAGLYSRPLLLALVAEGIFKDTSAIPAIWQEATRWDASQTPVVSAYSVYLSESNGSLFEGGKYDERSTQPSRLAVAQLSRNSSIDTSQLSETYLTEYPINGAMVDSHFPAGSRQALNPGAQEAAYIQQTVDSILAHYQKIAAVYEQNREKTHYLQYGVHFEFYPIYHKALPRALALIFADAKRRNIPLDYAKLPLPR